MPLPESLPSQTRCSSYCHCGWPYCWQLKHSTLTDNATGPSTGDPITTHPTPHASGQQPPWPATDARHACLECPAHESRHTDQSTTQQTRPHIGFTHSAMLWQSTQVPARSRPGDHLPVAPACAECTSASQMVYRDGITQAKCAGKHHAVVAI